jgi:hypothetical protein
MPEKEGDAIAAMIAATSWAVLLAPFNNLDFFLRIGTDLPPMWWALGRLHSRGQRHSSLGSAVRVYPHGMQLTPDCAPSTLLAYSIDTPGIS